MIYSYHNTTDITGSLLDQYERKAINQDEAVLNFFTEMRI